MEELIVKNQELREILVKDINSSQLPAFAIKNILKDLLEQINIIEKTQFEEAKKNIDNKKNKEPLEAKKWKRKYFKMEH